jgi:hypothetical protein
MIKLENEDDLIYYLWKMIPPGKSYFFYSSGGEYEGKAFTAKDHKSTKLPVNKTVRNI